MRAPTAGQQIHVSTQRYRFHIVREAEPAYPMGSTVSSPREVVAIAQHVIGSEICECLIAIFFDARHRVIGYAEVARGTLNATRFTPRDVLVPALKIGCAALAVAHNHPSGAVDPSRADRVVTAALRSACELIGIPLLDHVIVTETGFWSFADSQEWNP